jgi:hypothetical protein
MSVGHVILSIDIHSKTWNVKKQPKKKSNREWGETRGVSENVKTEARAGLKVERTGSYHQT